MTTINDDAAPSLTLHLEPTGQQEQQLLSMAALYRWLAGHVQIGLGLEAIGVGPFDITALAWLDGGALPPGTLALLEQAWREGHNLLGPVVDGREALPEVAPEIWGAGLVRAVGEAGVQVHGVDGEVRVAPQILDALRACGGPGAVEGAYLCHLEEGWRLTVWLRRPGSTTA